MFPQPLFVDRFGAQEHVLQAQGLPECEDVLAPEEDVATRLQIVLFLDTLPGDGFADLKSVLGLNEGHIVNDKDAWLFDPFQFLHNLLRADRAVPPAIECPGAAERTIPRTTPRELDGRAGVENPEEVLAPVAQQVAGGSQMIEGRDELRRRTVSVAADDAGHPGDRLTI